MVRILYGISLLWILIPGYAAALALTFFVPRIFTGIAFDSGGVCTGPMTSTFLLPLAMGTAEGAGRGLMENAFGIIAVIAMAPLVVIQILGLIYRSKLTVQDTETREELEALTADADADVIVEYDVYGAGGVS